MEKTEAMLLAGIIAAVIWMGLCVIMEGKKRKYVIIAGIMIDIVLFIICKNWEMLFIGVIGGFVCGLGFGNNSVRKYEKVVQEMKGIKNWVVVSIIFFVMIFMTMAVAYPDLKFDLR